MLTCEEYIELYEFLPEYLYCCVNDINADFYERSIQL